MQGSRFLSRVGFLNLGNNSLCLIDRNFQNILLARRKISVFLRKFTKTLQSKIYLETQFGISVQCQLELNPGEKGVGLGSGNEGDKEAEEK
ncbi:hypothetical protein BV378_27345 [Nostoc sp. RF31YmG]|nr:hypothetical protein BV378_27345 [Nostoc sp. RF31YmG]